MRAPAALLLVYLAHHAASIHLELAEMLAADDDHTTCSPDVGLTTPQMIKRQGYPVEEHQVTTADDYVLTMYRIPRPGRPVVFLQHGLLGSSDMWVETGPDQALAYTLYHQDYDVWMGNARGNVYSREHKTLSTAAFTGSKYWDFSWHEMGVHDLPAEIDHVLAHTGRAQLTYVGHSMGTTMFWVLCSERPEYNARVKQMHALSPVAFFRENPSNPFLIVRLYLMLRKMFVPRSDDRSEFLPVNGLFKLAAQQFFLNKPVLPNMCMNVYSLLFGFDAKHYNKTAVPVILSHLPAGGSTKTAVHFTQQIGTGKFRWYDQGSPRKNFARYGSEEPPEYDLSKVTAPVYLYYGDKDSVTTPRDVSTLRSRLPNCQGKLRVACDNFNHLDFLWGTKVKALLYNKMVHLMGRASSRDRSAETPHNEID